MRAWKLVLDEEAFQRLLSAPSTERRRVLALLEELRRNPYRRTDYRAKDDTGRDLSVLAVRPFMVTYWRDELAAELRVVNIQRVRY